MKVSVVIPAYNEGEYIKKSLQSIHAQSEPPDEVIVVDNNSTDNTAEIAKQNGARVIHEKNQGMIPARNRGFDEARCEIIARTDADTTVSRYWVEEMKRCFQDPSVVAASGPTLFDKKITLQLSQLNATFTHLFGKLMTGHETLFGPNMGIRKSVWEKVRDEVCSDEQAVHEDFDLAIHVAHYGDILFDPSLVAVTSGRRLSRPTSMYFEYPIRSLRTRLRHSQFWKRLRSF